MSREPTRTLNLNSVVKYPNVNIIVHCILAMQNSVRDDLVECFAGVLDIMQTIGPHDLDLFRYLSRSRHRVANLIIDGALNRDWIKH